MTEQDWLAGSHLGKMLYFLSEEGGRERKLRLFTLACCRRLGDLVSDARLARALDGLEAHADGLLDGTGLREREDAAQEAVNEIIEVALRDAEGMVRPNDISSAANAVRCALSADYSRQDLSAGYTLSTSSVAFYVRAARTSPVWASTHDRVLTDEVGTGEERAMAELLADIIGNPFRPLPFPPAWRTDTAVALARQMYQSRGFGAMPILADALQDAGCDSDDVLDHCRDRQQVHVRGCWVIDGVLGKS
jgi:hypothetical protein